jgi:hypothetical protein
MSEADVTLAWFNCWESNCEQASKKDVTIRRLQAGNISLLCGETQENDILL